MLRAVGPSSKEDLKGVGIPSHIAPSATALKGGVSTGVRFLINEATQLSSYCVAAADKSTQAKDLKVAKRLAAEWSE